MLSFRTRPIHQQRKQMTDGNSLLCINTVFWWFYVCICNKKVYRGRAFSWEIYRQSIGVDVDDHQWF